MHRFLVFLMIVISIGCVHGVKKESEQDFQGLWQAMVIDENDSVGVTLNLYYDNGALAGKFAILNAPLTDGDLVFDVSNIEIRENKIKLVVLTSGVLDQDAFEIQAQLENDQLVGMIQEIKKGSKPIPLVFKRAP